MTAKREASNVYSLDGGKALAITRYCYVYAYHEEAVVDWSGSYLSKITFEGSDESCDLKLLLVKSEQTSGRYRVQVSQAYDGLFEVDLGDIYLKAPMCFHVPFGETATLEWRAGSGRLIFEDSEDTCIVESVWTKARTY